MGGTASAARCFPGAAGEKKCYLLASDCYQTASVLAQTLWCLGGLTTPSNASVTAAVTSACVDNARVSHITDFYRTPKAQRRVQFRCEPNGVATVYSCGSAPTDAAVLYRTTMDSTAFIPMAIHLKCSACQPLLAGVPGGPYPTPVIVILASSALSTVVVFVLTRFCNPIVDPALRKLKAHLVCALLRERGGPALQRYEGQLSQIANLPCLTRTDFLNYVAKAASETCMVVESRECTVRDDMVSDDETTRLVGKQGWKKVQLNRCDEFQFAYAALLADRRQTPVRGNCLTSRLREARDELTATEPAAGVVRDEKTAVTIFDNLTSDGSITWRPFEFDTDVLNRTTVAPATWICAGQTLLSLMMLLMCIGAALGQVAGLNEDQRTPALGFSIAMVRFTNSGAPVTAMVNAVFAAIYTNDRFVATDAVVGKLAKIKMVLSTPLVVANAMVMAPPVLGLAVIGLCFYPYVVLGCAIVLYGLVSWATNTRAGVSEIETDSELEYCEVDYNSKQTIEAVVARLVLRWLALALVTLCVQSCCNAGAVAITQGGAYVAADYGRVLSMSIGWHDWKLDCTREVLRRGEAEALKFVGLLLA